jgi:hypothetical protein
VAAADTARPQITAPVTGSIDIELLYMYSKSINELICSIKSKQGKA